MAEMSHGVAHIASFFCDTSVPPKSDTSAPLVVYYAAHETRTPTFAASQTERVDDGGNLPCSGLF